MGLAPRQQRPPAPRTTLCARFFLSSMLAFWEGAKARWTASGITPPSRPQVLQPIAAHVAVVVRSLSARPVHVLRLGEEALHFGPEAFIGTRLRDDAQHRHEVREPFVQLDFSVLDAPAVLGNAHPRDVDVLVDVRLAGLRFHELRQFVDDLPVFLQLQPSGVEYPQRNAFLRVVAGLLRDRCLPGLGERP